MQLTLQLGAFVAIVCIIRYSVGYVVERLFSRHGLPASLPWAGCEENNATPVARAKATLRSFFAMKELIDDGYRRVSFSRKRDILNLLSAVFQSRQAVHPPKCFDRTGSHHSPLSVAMAAESAGFRYGPERNKCPVSGGRSDDASPAHPLRHHSQTRHQPRADQVA